MTDAEKAQNLIDDLSWVMGLETYQRFLVHYDHLCRQNEVGRGSDVSGS
ncbi:hypothetical protein ACFP7A_00950 [Sporolactobacillus kofuensis]|uniref:Uncharacterized protein n=1 Tax=Sporolactobacillus kofuensis TaxID=269672 RepID=A0ABW1WAI0_9BACL|nr:hypothetical protein [Sporolactobacillus kofuensis]MCO7175530.1 hypothetical protein [Sporolactobacillus kofuensis]